MKTISVSLLALVLTGPARAQSAAAVTPAGDDIVVVASRSDDGRARDLLGSSATVIDARALEDRQARLVSDVLRDVPGVAVNRLGAVGDLTQVRIRGTEGNQVLVLIDGIKADDPYQGEYDFGTLPADDQARIEVLRGQQSSLYGSDAIGGVISYSTLSGREAPGIRLKAEGGAFGTIDGTARVAGVTGDLDYALSGSALHDRGYPVAPGGARDLGATLAGVTGKLAWTPAANLKLIAVGRYNHTHGDTDDLAPNPAAGAVAGQPLVAAVDAPREYFVNRAVAGLVRAELATFDGAMTTAASAQLADTTRHGFTAAGFDNGDHGRRQRYALEDTLRLGADTVRHRFTVALDAEREDFRNTTPGAFVDRSGHVLHTYGLVGQYALTLGDRFGLGASVRHDWNDFFGDDTTFHADASYLLPSGMRLHAAGGTGIKDPGAFELFDYSAGTYIGNPDLRPEKSRGWEAGVDQALPGRRARVGVTYFDSRLHHEIETIYVGPAFTASSVNSTTATRQRGVEAFAEVRLADVRVDAAYTHLHAPQTRDVLATPAAAFPTPVSAQAIRRPRDIASLNVTYAPKSAPFSATLTVRYNGRQTDVAYTPAFAALYVDLKAYTLVDLAATYDLTRQLQLFARAENLAGERYQEAFGYRAPGRAGYGGVRLRF